MDAVKVILLINYINVHLALDIVTKAPVKKSNPRVNPEKTSSIVQLDRIKINNVKVFMFTAFLLYWL